jgi:hypothetical protein
VKKLHAADAAEWEKAVLEEYDKYFLWCLAEKPGETPMSFVRFRAFHIMQGIDPREDVQRP